MAETQTKKESPKDGLALIVGGLFILALVFATYNYFNKSTKTSDVEKIQQETVFEEQNAQEGDLNGPGASTVNAQGFGGSMVLGTVGPVTPAVSQWIANDYSKDDIKGTSYTVKSGDTLWEIAEAVYGNGAEWTKILGANKASVDYLPNGSQALIRPGQVLVLP
jgi:nucleoid-associated protein YgaU